MPIYLYDCGECGPVELRHPPGKPPKEHACGSKLRRVWSVPALRFKGSGFYSTDSASRSGRQG